MRRVQARAGRSGVALLLSVLVLVAGFAGVGAQAPGPTAHASGHHTSDVDLDLGTPAAQPQRASHVLRLDGPAPGWVPTGTDPVGGSVVEQASTATAAPHAATDRSDLGGRAPPA